jgi:hypothetical protein
MAQDVFKLFKDLELKAVGLDEKTNKMQEGYFVAFRNIGLPVHKDDYKNPWTPLGENLKGDMPPPADPATAPKTGSDGIDLAKAFAANIAQSQGTYLSTFALVDNKLQMNNQYSVMPGSSKLSDSWWAIMTGANGIPPTMELNDAMKQAYADATAKLMDKDGNVTPHYQAYMDREDDYKSKVKARNKAYAAAFTDPMKLQQWPQDGVPYQDDVEEAWDRWMSLGFKMEIEKAIATLAAQGTDPAIALIARAKKKFQNSLFEFSGYGEIPYTVLSPRTWYDKDNDDGWNEYTSTDFHSESQYSASQTAYSGGGGVNLGLWSGNVDFQHQDSQASGKYQMKNVKISFNYAIADVNRPWLDTSLLNLSNWFLVGDYKKNCISTGMMAQQVPGTGSEPTFLPSVVTSLILIKDVHISWDDWQSQWAEHQSSNSASASVGVWCFSAHASYSHASQSREFSCDASGEDLSIPGIQVIGYVSQILPASPQKNSSDYEQKAKATTTTASTGTQASTAPVPATV